MAMLVSVAVWLLGVIGWLGMKFALPGVIAYIPIKFLEALSQGAGWPKVYERCARVTKFLGRPLLIIILVTVLAKVLRAKIAP